MLTHLLECEHKTAYSSEEEARANTVRSVNQPSLVQETTKVTEETPPADTVSVCNNIIIKILKYDYFQLNTI